MVNEMSNKELIQEAIDLESQWFADIDIEAYFQKINKLLEKADTKYRIVYKLKNPSFIEIELDQDFDSEFEATKFLNKFRNDPFIYTKISYAFVRAIEQF